MARRQIVTTLIKKFVIIFFSKFLFLSPYKSMSICIEENVLPEQSFYCIEVGG